MALLFEDKFRRSKLQRAGNFLSVDKDSGIDAVLWPNAEWMCVCVLVDSQRATKQPLYMFFSLRYVDAQTAQAAQIAAALLCKSPLNSVLLHCKWMYAMLKGSYSINYRIDNLCVNILMLVYDANTRV